MDGDFWDISRSKGKKTHNLTSPDETPPWGLQSSYSIHLKKYLIEPVFFVAKSPFFKNDSFFGIHQGSRDYHPSISLRHFVPPGEGSKIGGGVSFIIAFPWGLYLEAASSSQGGKKLVQNLGGGMVNASIKSNKMPSIQQISLNEFPTKLMQNHDWVRGVVEELCT